MTDKKRRQRGTRTHGGGSQKNRRGAGNRGGRGRAGRSDHEFHNYEPIGKHGFKRPQKTQRDVREVDVGHIDEDVAVLAAEGLAEEEDGGYRVDARDVVEDGHEADAVKVLGGGQVRHELTIVADDFSERAEQLLDEAGGEAVLSERGEAAAAEPEEVSEESADES